MTASNVDKHIIDGEIPMSLCNCTDVYYNRHILMQEYRMRLISDVVTGKLDVRSIASAASANG